MYPMRHDEGGNVRTYVLVLREPAKRAGNTEVYAFGGHTLSIGKDFVRLSGNADGISYHVPVDNVAYVEEAEVNEV